MRSSPILLVLMLAAGALLPLRAETGRTGAPDLMASAEQAYNSTLQAARRAGARLDPADPRNGAFWNSLSRMGSALQQVRADLDRRDPRFFETLRTGSQTLAEMRVVWTRSGVDLPDVDSSLAVLAANYRLLRGGYGREGFRERQGPSLSPAEQAQLARVQEAHRRLAEQLRLISSLASERGDEETVSQLEPFLSDAERIGSEEPTLDTYLEASLSSDTLEGEWTALSEGLSQQYPEEWQGADEIMADLSVESDVGFVLAANLGKVASYLDEKGDVEGEPVANGAGTGSPEAGSAPSREAGRSGPSENGVPGAELHPEAVALRRALEGKIELRPEEKGRFRLFAGREAREAFHLWSDAQRSAPPSYWLGLAEPSRAASRAAPTR